MKQIVAYVKSHKLPAVALALQNLQGLTGMSFSTVHGFGRGRAKDASQKIVRDLVDFVAMDRIEIFCSDEVVAQVTDSIISSAHEGQRGDGKIYVCEVIEAFRIGTKERGTAAV
ncbi:MAG: P-II family nitrogen regulator [Candidatus Zixiibacteriota bacterium]